MITSETPNVPDANEQDRELQPKIASFQPLLPRLIRKNQWRNDHDDVTGEENQNGKYHMKDLQPHYGVQTT